MKRYYDRRADEYDATVLDAGCGTGWLTRRLAGEVTGLDQSSRMLEHVRRRVPAARFVQADVPPLPFADDEFDLVFASHLVGHLPAPKVRARFIAEALRAGRELVVVEQRWPDGIPEQRWERRRLSDGSEHLVFKRYFTPATLAAEIDGDVAFENDSYTAARRRR